MFRIVKKKKTKKNFSRKKKSKIKNFLATSLLFCLLDPYISTSTNIFEKKFTYASRSQRVEPVLKML